jgi:hypothetical protein
MVKQPAHEARTAVTILRTFGVVLGTSIGQRGLDERKIHVERMAIALCYGHRDCLSELGNVGVHAAALSARHWRNYLPWGPQQSQCHQ